MVLVHVGRRPKLTEPTAKILISIPPGVPTSDVAHSQNVDITAYKRLRCSQKQPSTTWVSSLPSSKFEPFFFPVPRATHRAGKGLQKAHRPTRRRYAA